VKPLPDLLDSIRQCNACGLMGENRAIGIPYVPILPKPNARVMFIGRDPSPRTATVVGHRGGRSVFINAIFDMVDQAKISEEHSYITDLCKCHWRTSAGSSPLPGTEHRTAKLDVSRANVCMNHWLLHEIETLTPRLIVAFGEELYQLLRPLVSNPQPPPRRFSATRDKSVLDAELWFAEHGTLSLSIGQRLWPLAVLRHPGNWARLPQSSRGDLRHSVHGQAIKRVVTLMMES
jgi:uracil-DNA glycosylase